MAFEHMKKPPTAAVDFPCALTGEMITVGEIVMYIPGVGFVKVLQAAPPKKERNDDV